MIVLLSVKAGLRAAEIANLNWEMVLDPSGAIGTVLELRNRAAKKGHGRIIPLFAPPLRGAARPQGVTAMDVTYYVALPFVAADDGVAAGEAVECFNPNAAVMKAEALSRKPGIVGAVAFSRSGDPATGDFGDATVIRKFGDVPDDLSAL